LAVRDDKRRKSEETPPLRGVTVCEVTTLSDTTPLRGVCEVRGVQVRPD
jgi:hypothetical protein